MLRKKLSKTVAGTILVIALLVAMSYNLLIDKIIPCSSADQNLILAHAQAFVQARQAGDVRRCIEILQSMEMNLSPSCRAEVYKSQPQATACSSAEQNLISTYVQASMQAALADDMVRSVQILQAMAMKLSPSCQAALAQSQQQAQAYAGQSSGYPPKVQNLGNGMLSVPGVGACGPSGCIGFRR